MNAITTGLIIAALLAAPGEAASDPGSAQMADNESNTVYQCDFESATDENFDTWPDNWKRRGGRGFPRYIKVAIQRDDVLGAAAEDGLSNDRNHYLKIELDGGAASVYSPQSPVSSVFSYVLTARMKTKGLVNSRAFVSVEFLDDAGKVHGDVVNSPLTAGDGDWQNVSLGPVTPGSSKAKFVRIGLHVHPQEQADLTGSAMFDDIRFARLPRMTLSSDVPHRVYQLGDRPEITCNVSGIRSKMPLVDFELLNRQGAPVLRSVVAIDGAHSGTTAAGIFHGSAVWSPKIAEPGFYHLRVTMKTAGGELKQSTTLAVLTNLPAVESGEFGWSIPQQHPHELAVLPGLLAASSVHWVKLPVWYDHQHYARGEELARFTERLVIKNINLVGVLDQPPASTRIGFPGSGNAELPAASVFLEPEVWRPLVDPIMTRLSLNVHWWQLGNDTDFSFVDYAGLNEKIAEIKTSLERFGQAISIGIPWKWINNLPGEGKPAYQFLSLDEGVPFTHEELAAYLNNSSSATAQRWVTMRPLPRSQYSPQQRARDLVLRMVAAKQHAANVAFVPDPFNNETGVMNEDGAPGELLLPWRTAAATLSGAKFIGSIVMPNGSHNLVFSRNGEAVMVVWSDQPTREIIYLGDKVRQLDVWGSETTPTQDGNRQVIECTQLPVFLTGVNEAVMRWRMDFRFPDSQLQSVFGRNQWTAFEFTNHFKQGLGGSIELQTPHTWGIERKRQDFTAAQNEKVTRRFGVLLKSGASTGIQPVRADFVVRAAKTYEFSVYRKMQVGLGDVMIKLQTTRNAAGDLVVHQTFLNNTDEQVNFNCMLFAPQQRRQRIQVLRQGRGRNMQTYIYPDGGSLTGKTLWLRAEEIRGSRILNYQIQVQP